MGAQHVFGAGGSGRQTSGVLRVATFRAARVNILCGSSWKQGLTRDSARRAPLSESGPSPRAPCGLSLQTPRCAKRRSSSMVGQCPSALSLLTRRCAASEWMRWLQSGTSRTPAVDLARGTASTVSCGSSCGLSVALSLTWSMFPARNSCWKTEGSTPSAARLNTKKTRLPTAMDGALPTSGYSAHRSGPAAPSLLTSSPTVTTIGSPCSSLRKFCAESGHPD